jgi:hypothetical protein
MANTMPMAARPKKKKWTAKQRADAKKRIRLLAVRKKRKARKKAVLKRAARTEVLYQLERHLNQEAYEIKTGKRGGSRDRAADLYKCSSEVSNARYRAELREDPHTRREFQYYYDQGNQV